jgi:hypothetical protein
VRCRDDLRCARTAARHRVVKALLRHGHIYRQGKAWTLRHRAWVESQRLADPLAHAALEHMLTVATMNSAFAFVYASRSCSNVCAKRRLSAPYSPAASGWLRR